MREQTFQRLLKPHSCGASWRDKKLPAGGTQPKSLTGLSIKRLRSDGGSGPYNGCGNFSFYLYFLPVLCYNAYDNNT